jgi:galactonate dehydratase
VRSVSLVEAARDAVGPDVEVLVEMHGRFTPATAVAVARELEPLAPSWIEEPVPPENLKALQKVSERVNIPVATGERLHTRYEFTELFERQAADVIQPDIMHSGGILEIRKLAATAETHYVLVAPHNVGGPVATAANLQLAACVPNFKIQEHFNDFADARVREVAPGLPEIGEDGCFPVPEGPGLGVQMDWDAVAEHPPEAVSFDLFAEGWEKREAPRSP